MDLRKEYWRNAQATAHRVEVCNGTTGHTLRAVAMCDDTEYAKDIVRAVNSHDALVKALEKAESILGMLRGGYGDEVGSLAANGLKVVSAALAAAKGGDK